MALAPRLAARTDIFSKTFVECLSKILGPVDTTITPVISLAYGLDPTSTANTPESTNNILNFGNDLCFTLALQSFARAWSTSPVHGTESFLYRFNCPNSWDGPWKGHATHILDIAFLLLNYREYLSPGQQLSVERFAKDIITFLHEGRPWTKYQDGIGGGSMVYYAPMDGNQDMSRFVGNGASETMGREDVLESLVGPELLDNCMDAWQMFTAGPRSY